MPRHEDVEFKTFDGLTLRGWLYPADVRGAAVILTPGVSTSLVPTSPMREDRWLNNTAQFACVKEMFVSEVEETFQLAGITALIYDPRNTGTSDGMPRQEIDPIKQAEDYSDALTFLAGLPMVDPHRIAF